MDGWTDAGTITETGLELKLKILACASIQRLIGGIHLWNLARSGRRVAHPLVAVLQFLPCRCLEVFLHLTVQHRLSRHR